MDDSEIEQQIERCRRLASMITDPDVRQSLAELADEFEAQRTEGSDSFMLGRRSGAA